MKIVRITLVVCITIAFLISCVKTKNQEKSISDNISKKNMEMDFTTNYPEYYSEEIYITNNNGMDGILQNDYDDIANENVSNNDGKILFYEFEDDYETPRVREDFYLNHYAGFLSRLPKLDGESSLRLINNLPNLDGATAFYPLYVSFVQAVYPEYFTVDFPYWVWRNGSSVRVFSSRTDGAYNCLLDGSADIIFCFEPSQEQLQKFRDRNINLKFVPIGKEAFVFFVNIENPVRDLSVEDIKGIYSGRITNWNRLRGIDSDIIAFQRPEGSGSQTILERIMDGTPILRAPRELISQRMEEAINRVADYRNLYNAIGYSFLIFSTEMVRNDQIKHLSINEVYPSFETIMNNSYPFSVSIYAIYNDSEDKNINIEQFVEWILSKQGQLLVSKGGYIPINNNIE
jgi:phosphate transport system substrate-binding protein